MAGHPRFLSVAGPAPSRLWRPLLLSLLLFLLCLAPRLVAIGRYITPDELIWVFRALQFREALLDGNWAGTLVAGHPGVTTTWLGALGIGLQTALSPSGRDAYLWLTNVVALTPENVAAFRRLALFLTGGRVAVAVVNSLGIVAAYWMARRLWSGRAALAGGLLLALDPYLAGLSGLFHVDGLSATFTTLALLSLAVGLAGRGRAVLWLAVSGALAALAALSKTPALLLLPVAATAMLWPALRQPEAGRRAQLVGVVRHGLTWLIAFGVTTVVLYPALWAGPAGVMEIVGASASRHLEEALRETFFLGRAAFDHGPLFYPVVVLWRLSPVVWLALIPAARLLAQRPAAAWQRAGWFAAGLLVAWAVLFLVAITPAAKKFDRYILPVVPSLLIVAAVVWATWAGRMAQRGRWVLSLVVAAQGVFWLAFAAYPLAAYNPLVGGPWSAARVLPAGWGEGISAAARWLDAVQSDAGQRTAIAGITPALAPFYPGRVLVDGVDDPAEADFQITTRGGRQLVPEAVAAQTAGLELIHTVHFGGLDQAWIYRRAAPRPANAPPELPAAVVFGERLALVALSQQVDDETVRLATQWQRLATPAEMQRFTLRLAVTDAAGNVWSSQETDLLNEVAFRPVDWEADRTATLRYALELPPAMPPGRYTVLMSLVDRSSAGQLPVRVGDEPLGVTYRAADVEVPRPGQIVSASRVQIPQINGTRWHDGALWLLGNGTLPEGVLAGSDLPVELFWHAPDEPLPSGLQLAWALRPLDGGSDLPLSTVPLSRFDTGQWRVGETVQEKYRLPIPPPTRAGRYALLLQPLDATGQSLGPAEVLGELTIDNIDRLYDVPVDVARPLLDDCFGGTICLRGVMTPTWAAVPGQTVELTLYWQALVEPTAVYTAFLHVLNKAGETVLSADHWPGGLPSDIWDVGQVIEDRVSLALPADLPPGAYRVRLGLYTADDGRRLPLDGTTADYLILPWTLNVVAP